MTPAAHGLSIFPGRGGPFTRSILIQLMVWIPVRSPLSSDVESHERFAVPVPVNVLFPPNSANEMRTADRLPVVCHRGVEHEQARVAFHIEPGSRVVLHKRPPRPENNG